MKAARRFTLPSLLEEGPFSRRTRVRTWSDSLIMDQSQGISSSLVWAFLKRILSRFFPIDAPHSPRASAMSPVIEAPTWTLLYFSTFWKSFGCGPGGKGRGKGWEIIWSIISGTLNRVIVSRVMRLQGLITRKLILYELIKSESNAILTEIIKVAFRKGESSALDFMGRERFSKPVYFLNPNKNR